MDGLPWCQTSCLNPVTTDKLSALKYVPPPPRLRRPRSKSKRFAFVLEVKVLDHHVGFSINLPGSDPVYQADLGDLGEIGVHVLGELRQLPLRTNQNAPGLQLMRRGERSLNYGKAFKL